MSKQSLLHGGSLLKPPSPLKQGRHSLGIRNGGLDFVKAAVRSSIGHGDCLLNDGFFSFAVARQEPLLSKSILHCYKREGMSNSRIFYLRELLMPFPSRKIILKLYHERSECI